MADLALLRTFLAIYRTGSLTRAARQLRLTQPAISQQLKALETHVGWPLFTRTARGVVPTPAAEELAVEVASHVDALEIAVEKLRPGAQGSHGLVHVGGRVDFLATCILPALAGAWSAGLRVVAHPAFGPSLRESLRRGDLHVALADRSHEDDDLEFEPLVEYDAVLVASPARAARLRAMTPAARAEALGAGPFVSYTEEMPRLRHVLETCFDAEPDAEPAIVVPDLRACAEIVAAGDAVAVLERPLARSFLERRAIEELPSLRPCPRSTLYMGFRRGTAGSPRIRSVAQLLRDAAPRWGSPRVAAPDAKERARVQGSERKPHV